MYKSSTTKTTVFLLLLLAVSGLAKAQEYLQETKEYYPLIPKSGERQWDTKVEFIWGDTEYEVCRFGDDIELDGVLYRKMMYVMDYIYYSTGLVGAFREEDKKVYVRWWQPGLQYYMEEKLYYDFNLQVGDSFDVGWDEPCFIQVVAVEEVELEDGSVRNKFVFNDGWEDPEVWIEGVGSLAGVANRFDPDLMSSSFSYLKCYFEDDDLVWTDGECWDDIEEAVTEQVGLYPNPAKDMVHIEGVTDVEVQVYNALGQLVKTVCRTNEIDLSGLVDGVYLLRIISEDGNTQLLKVLKESK